MHVPIACPSGPNLLGLPVPMRTVHRCVRCCPGPAVLGRPAGTALYHKPRDSWKIKRSWGIEPNGTIRTPNVYDTDVLCQIQNHRAALALAI